jgi:hypothetical protein
MIAARVIIGVGYHNIQNLRAKNKPNSSKASWRPPVRTSAACYLITSGVNCGKVTGYASVEVESGGGVPSAGTGCSTISGWRRALRVLRVG